MPARPDIAPPSPLLQVRGLCYDYPDGTRALQGASFSLAEGEKLALVGVNGSGKSTLMLHLSGCLPANAGEILLRGETVGKHLSRLRGAVGMIFQEPDDQLFMPTVCEDVAFGLVARGMPAEAAREEALRILETLGVPHLAERPPHRLSGGEKRMVALAGILVTNPDLIVLDEPSAALDPRARRHVIEVLRELDKPMILASHDLDMVLDICTRSAIMREGCIAAEGCAEEVLRDAVLLKECGLELPLRHQFRRADTTDEGTFCRDCPSFHGAQSGDSSP